MAPTTTTTIEPTPRPSSRGAFELHVQSVRAARGLPHLVVTPNTPNPNAPAYVVPPSIPVAAYRSSDEKSSFDNDDSDSGSISIVVGEAKSESRNRSGNRLTNDDGPEPRTLARDLFLFGFCEYTDSILSSYTVLLLMQRLPIFQCCLSSGVLAPRSSSSTLNTTKLPKKPQRIHERMKSA